MASTRPSRRAGRASSDAPSVTNTDINARGYPGERHTIVASAVNEIQGVRGPDDTIIDLTGLYIRVAPKESFDSGDLSDAQDRIVQSYDPATYTFTVTSDWDTNPIANEWDYILIGRPGRIASGISDSCKFILIDTSFTGANRDTLTGTTLRFLDGPLLEQTFLVESYDPPTFTVTVTPKWTEDPVAGNTFVIYGERAEGVVSSSGSVNIIDPLLVDTIEYTIGTGDIQDAIYTYKNTYRGMQVEIVSTASLNDSPVGQVREVIANESGILTLDRKFQAPIGEQVSVVITGGWTTPYKATHDNTFALVQIVSKEGQHGVRHTYQSTTESGYNRESATTHRETRPWGQRSHIDDAGISMESSPLVGAFYRVQLICFSPALTGSFRARFADSAVLAEAQVDDSAAATALTDGVSSGGDGGGGGPSANVNVVSPLGNTAATNSVSVNVRNSTLTVTQGTYANLQTRTEIGQFNAAVTGATITDSNNALAVTAVGGVAPRGGISEYLGSLSSTAVDSNTAEDNVVTHLNFFNRSPNFLYYVKIYDEALGPPDEFSTPIMVCQVKNQSSTELSVNLYVNSKIYFRATNTPDANETEGPSTDLVFGSLIYV